MGVTCDSIRAGAVALVALAWLGGPAAAEAPTPPRRTADAASAPPRPRRVPRARANAPADCADAAGPAQAAAPQDAAAPAVDPQRRRRSSAALDALVAADVKTSPIGAGDWRAARLAIRAFYAARGFAPVWVDGHGLNRARPGRARPPRARRRGRRSISPPSPCPRTCRPTRRPSGSPKPKRAVGGRRSPTRCRRADRASCRPASRR